MIIILFLQSGDYYWRMIDGTPVSEPPQLINSYWKGLPGNIDAAFSLYDRYTFFFKVKIENEKFIYIKIQIIMINLFYLREQNIGDILMIKLMEIIFQGKLAKIFQVHQITLMQHQFQLKMESFIFLKDLIFGNFIIAALD